MERILDNYKEMFSWRNIYTNSVAVVNAHFGSSDDTFWKSTLYVHLYGKKVSSGGY